MRNYIFIADISMSYVSEDIWVSYDEAGTVVFYHHFQRYNTFDTHTYLETTHNNLLINI